ncbi:hypothetical protein CO019_01235 [Candidatus Berkelbacteria bacterium CG_4_9_14_0_2_um_filter_42_30]|uniref:SpoVT-AbrB domain-containing protein n=5 Tax=Candidatus Berkelbacteria TaxID=1618330 RepID=A0A2M7K1B1_9BACT|nr:MAG: hypothetical protein AUJ40_01350 [Candidatus Berkelbacteria bacterium CG1_02_42_45]PIR27108.1 MAG: hypothetical protein COV40_02640 [Candidatus Berkelbacteria bacterium CG11_big_fil_rev_8_21_14_0_20_42_15]PIX30053.1 MAG: hypothetical protein COZ63_01810 [Candidatus Berkelbacteria bacterium CG_4_8_14_3_um_filter_42_13]PIZ27824.1 MAG: hypothetical protein COY45_00375 [Candidatus Berkelbacteria bacterium CG_4_10_14_0_8_um_filter_42_34]PJC65712.1 MAG: hypothetical protein CO019_01235 [Candi
MESDQSRPVPVSAEPSPDGRAEAEDRKLIKFSNYSLCVTLPKWVIRKLKWGKGDVVRMIVNENKGEILIRKGLRIPREKELVKKAVLSTKKTSTGKSTPKPSKARW